MINLPIHITTHHLTLSEPLRRFTREKIRPVTRFAIDALAAEIVLRRDNNGAKIRFSASACGKAGAPLPNFITTNTA